jgi:hypothetical protein
MADGPVPVDFIDQQPQDLPDYAWSLGGGWAYQYHNFLNCTTNEKHSQLEQILQAPETPKTHSSFAQKKHVVVPPAPLAQVVEHRSNHVMVGQDGVVRLSTRCREGDGIQCWSLTRSGKFGFFSPSNRWTGEIRFEVLHYEDGRTERRRTTGEFTHDYPENHPYYREQCERIERYRKECGIVKVEIETEEYSGGQTVVHEEVIDMLRNRVEL